MSFGLDEIVSFDRREARCAETVSQTGLNEQGL
jgi:hypothetical protein